MAKKQRAEDVLREIAEFPLTKEHDRDKNGKIISGSNTYSEGYAAWAIQQKAKRWLEANRP